MVKDNVNINDYLDIPGYGYGDKLFVQKAPDFNATAREAFYRAYLLITS